MSEIAMSPEINVSVAMEQAMHMEQIEQRSPNRLRQLLAIPAASLALGAVGCVPQPADIHPRVHEINSTMKPSDAALARLAKCESTNNYAAVNKSGKYTGAFQFDQRTWDGAVVSGGISQYKGVRPKNAPPRVQDAAARILFKQRGRSPWPECGKRI